ncbi:MAG: DNA polymerase III subunit alpha [Candidatus Portnoybacteria bacterium CG11_big_fil_rev_8_21_14_0_20_44_10]|uniref:DNA polymerase III subunit alpha n=3 Tax=Candidatus Portnoyibacteriota TaxID=1817913 RepID=A0A2H0KP66_9BACT|nr:MAG: DNA polymerase III subunit alpha [Candidatus Portnoybacteria bacterium CG11_big_fil_rev_8_21_14_0_20_44_10]PJA63173.1 MAG: DNA polymerase III subunit alpha [Candidatus Portnoybacteria bacterium CG_4_9_14_3_um_filter_44_9]
MRFTHLHVHSHYSLLDGLPKINDLISRVKDLGMDSVALTDHGVMYGVVEFYKKAVKEGVKPIIGNEMYLAPRTRFDKEARIDQKAFHLLLLAKNKAGYENLIKLTTKAHLEGFYYKPRIDKELLREHADGLIGLTACLSGEIPRAIIAGNIEKAEELTAEYREILGPENFYLEVQHHPNLEYQEKVNQALIKLGKKLKISLVATHDVHYLNPDDADAQDILMAVQTGAKTDDEGRLTMTGENFSLQPPEQMIKWFSEIPEAIENTQKIVEQCNFQLKLGEIQLPHLKVPTGKTPEEYLKELCQRGLAQRYENITKEISDRLKYELGVIGKTGFASYFLIVQDFVNWSKNSGVIVGPGRGSAAGSLVSYLLNITDIDPLRYDLLFERFLNPERISMPDIDLDFADARRDEVIAYIREKYGEDHVAQIITFGTMAARAAIRDVGRVLNYPYTFCDQLAKMIPFGLTLQKAIDESAELGHAYKTDNGARKIINMAIKLEGVVRHASTHACGLVITRQTLDELTPRQHPAGDEKTIVTQYEMHSIEDLGLLKMDLLGLKNLTIIENALKIIKNTCNETIDISRLPLDDKPTYELLQEGKTTGVFQLESGGMKRNLKELKPTQFEDIIAMVALYRPGPIEFIPEFIARKHGLKEIEYLHPKLETILKNTYGICVYQEQLMAIAKELAGFTLTEADILRKAVGKKIKKLLDEQRGKMMNGMIRNGISEEIASKIWQWAEPFASYGFNRSHAACYAMVGYQTAYLKAHFPTEFMSALMTSEENDIERVSFLVDECQTMGVQILPPNINESLANFTVIETNQIRFGLRAIKNVGDNVVKTIINEKKANGPYKSISDFLERVQTKDLNKKSLESLVKSGAFDALGERNEFLLNMETLLSYAKETQKNKSNGQISLFGSNSKVANHQLKLAEVPPATKKEKLFWERELLGLYISGHPMREYKELLEKNSLPIGKITKQMAGKQVKVGGIINKIRKIVTRTGRPMLFVQIEDSQSKTEVIVFPNVLDKTATIWQEDKMVLITGKVSDRDEEIKIICDSVKEIT